MLLSKALPLIANFLHIDESNITSILYEDGSHLTFIISHCFDSSYPSDRYFIMLTTDGEYVRSTILN